MINFEEELKRFQPILEVNQAEEEIYSNDLKDISDIVMQMSQEIKNADMNAGGQLNSIVRR